MPRGRTPFWYQRRHPAGLADPRFVLVRRTAGGGRSRAGQARSITDLAEQAGVTDAYVCRLLPLTCLAHDIVEAILHGRQQGG